MSIQATDNKVSFVRTTKDMWGKQASKDNNAIVFLEDAKQIWSNGKYYNIRECYASDFVITTGDDCYQIQSIDSGDYFIWRDTYHMYDQFGTTFSFIPNALYKVIGPDENGEDACTYKPVWFYDKVIIYNNYGNNIQGETERGENEIPLESINNYTGDIFDQYGNEYIYNKEKDKFYPKFNKSQFSKNSSGTIGISIGVTSSLGQVLTSSGGVGIGMQPLTIDPTISDTLKIQTDRKLIINGKGTTELTLDSDGVKSDDFYDEYGNIRDTVISKYSFYSQGKSGQIIYLRSFDTNFTKDLSNNDIISIIFPSTSFNTTIIINWLNSNTSVLNINNKNIPLYYNVGMTINEAFTTIRQSLNTDICFFQPDTPYLFYYDYTGNKLIWLHQQGAGAQNYYIQNTYQNVDGSVVDIEPLVSTRGDTGIAIANYTINDTTGQICQKVLSYDVVEETDKDHYVLFKDSGADDANLYGTSSLKLNYHYLKYNAYTQTLNTPNILIENNLLYGADPTKPLIIKNKYAYETGQQISILNDTITGNLNGHATSATNLTSTPSLATSGTTQITVTAGGKTSSAFTVPYASIAHEVGQSLTINKGSDTISYNGSGAVGVVIPVITPGDGLQSSRPSTMTDLAPYWGSYSITENQFLKLRTADNTHLGGIKVTSQDDVPVGGIDYPVWLDEDSIAHVTVPNIIDITKSNNTGYQECYIVLHSNVTNQDVYSQSAKYIYSPSANVSYLKLSEPGYISSLKGASLSFEKEDNKLYAAYTYQNAYLRNNDNYICMQATDKTAYLHVTNYKSGTSAPSCKIDYNQIVVTSYEPITEGSNANDGHNFERKSEITGKTISTTQFISTQIAPNSSSDDPTIRGNIKCSNNSYTKSNPIFTVETANGEVYGFFIENGKSINVNETGYCDIVRLK